MITTGANELMASIHDRMPAFLVRRGDSGLLRRRDEHLHSLIREPEGGGLAQSSDQTPGIQLAGGTLL